MNIWAQSDMVGVEDECLGSNRHSWGGGRMAVLEGMWLEWRMSIGA